MTLRSRLTAAFVLVMLIPLALGVFAAQRSQTQVARTQQLGVATASRLTAATVESYCGRAVAAATVAARALAGESSASVAADVVQRGLADGLRIVTADGSAVTAGDAPVLTPARSCIRQSPAGTGTIAAVVPLSTGGRASGYVAAHYEAGNGLARRLQAVAGGGVVALLSGRQVVGHSGDVPAGLISAALDEPGSPVVFDGQVAVLSPSRPGQPLAVLLIQDQVRTGGLPLQVLAVVLGGVLLAVALAYLLARAITQPLGALGDAVGRIAAGDLDTRIEVRSGDELGRLGRAVNAMTSDLRSYVGELQASRRELRAGLERLGDTLSSTHDLHRILAVVLETAMGSVRASGGMVLLLDPARSVLVASEVHGVDVGPGLRVPLGVGVSGRVAQTGLGVCGLVGRSPGALAPGPGEPSVHSLVSVPLRGSGGVVGVLNLYNRRDHSGGLDPDGFDAEDLATLHSFAGQATVAVDNVLLHEEAQRLSVTDGLTGLFNYRHFTMTMAKEVDRAGRFGRPLALVLLDLDLFKLVNDTYGHQRGDSVLVELAQRLRGVVRDVDTVARYGGEEFVVLLPETDETGAAQAAERLCEAVRRTPFGALTDEPLEITASVGAAVFRASSGTAGGLLRRADEALYAAKRAGRDTWRLWPMPPDGSPEAVAVGSDAP